MEKDVITTDNVNNVQVKSFDDKFKNSNPRKKFTLVLTNLNIILAILIIIAFSIMIYNSYHIKQLPQDSLGANIEKVVIDTESDKIFIRLKSGIDTGTIESVKFYINNAGQEIVYETNVGTEKLSVSIKKGFFNKLFNKRFSGEYDYIISNTDLGIDNLDNINDIKVVFIVRDEYGNLIESNVLDSSDDINKDTIDEIETSIENDTIIISSGGGGGGGGGGGAASTSGTTGTTDDSGDDENCTIYYCLTTHSTCSSCDSDCNSCGAVISYFDVDAVAGISPLTVKFLSLSTGKIDSFFWDFGDGNNSTEQNPTYTYTSASGINGFEVSLTVTGSSGTDTSDTVSIKVYANDTTFPRNTYYIDATSGDDSNDGLSTSAPKQTLNSVSWPFPGDTILFKRGETWEADNGAALYLRVSGFADYPITYGAYGDSMLPKPTIKRQAIVDDWVNPGLWTNLDFETANLIDYGDRVSSVDRSPYLSRSLLPANYFSQDGDKFKIIVGGSANGDVEIATAYIGEKADSGNIYDMKPGTISQLTFSGNPGTFITGGGEIISDWINYSFDHTKDYIISLYINSSAKGMYATGEYYQTSYYKGSSVDYAGDAVVDNDYGRLIAYWNLKGYGLATNNLTATSNIWYKNYSSSDPERVWLSGTEAGVVENIARLNSNYRWIYSYNGGDSRLYIYSYDNPALAYSSMTVSGVAGSPVGGMINKDYMIFQDLDIQGGYRAALPLEGCSNIIVQDCNIGNASGTYGIHVESSVTKRYSRNGIIRRNNIDADNHIENYWHAETTDDGLSLIDGTVNWTVHDNYLDGWAHTGISIQNFDEVLNLENNSIYNNYVTCPDIEYGRGFAYHDSYGKLRNNDFHHNVIKDTKIRSQIQSREVNIYNNIIDGVNNQIRDGASQGIMIYRATSEDTYDIKIINNVFANTADPGLTFSDNNVQGDYYDNIVSNNIFYNTGYDLTAEDMIYGPGGSVSAEGVQLNIEDLEFEFRDHIFRNNIFYSLSALNLIYYGNDPTQDYLKTVAEFNSMNGNQGDVITENLDSNPMFVNPTDPDGADNTYWTSDDGFMLQSGSPGIDAGYDFGLTPFTGSAPDIGAYENY